MKFTHRFVASFKIPIKVQISSAARVMQPALCVKLNKLMTMKISCKCILVLLLWQAAALAAATSVTNIAEGCEAFHSLFLKSNGSLWGMGGNSVGQLGDGTFNSTNKPEEIVPGGVTAIAAGLDYSLFLKSDGSLWAMGWNNFGQLGDGTFNNTNKPEKIVASGVTAIAAGEYHSLFLKSDGSLWAIGGNPFGELGDGTFNNTSRPKEIVPSGVIAIAAGGGQSLFLKSCGSLWAMGWNEYGQLGDGTFNDTNQPEEIVASGATAIAAGGQHSVFLKSDGSLWTMGENDTGQLGDGTFTTNYPHGIDQPEEIVPSGVTAIAAGAYHCLFLKSDGSLWAMGDNLADQLGDGFIDDGNSIGTPTPEQVVPQPQPILTEALSTKTNLQFTAACGFGGNFYLLAGANLSQPVSQWSPVWTNVITSRYTNVFSTTLTNVVNSGNQQFYILQSQ